MIRAVRLVDVDDICSETIANDLVPRSLPSFSTSVVSASGLVFDRGDGYISHIRCVVDSPVITLSETPLQNGGNEGALTASLRINNSTICNARISIDPETCQMALLLLSNVSAHWIVWRFQSDPNDRLLSTFPAGDNAVFLPNRSFTFGSLISNATVALSAACLIPSSEPVAFYCMAFDNARILLIRAPALAGTDSPNFEHCFIEPTSFLSRIISYASSSQQSASVLSIDCFGDFEMGLAGAFILRSSNVLEFYNVSSKRRLLTCTSNPAVFNCPGAPLLARFIDSGNSRFIAVLHRSPKQGDCSLELSFCKLSFLPKLALTCSSTVILTPSISNLFVVDFGLLSSCIFLACQTNDGMPLCFFVPSKIDGDSIVQTSGGGSMIQYWRRPVASCNFEEDVWNSDAEQLSHNVLSADCGSAQLLRQLLQSLRLPHMGMITSSVVSAGISAALSARQALATELNTSDNLTETTSRMAVETLSRKVENIWSKDRKVLGVSLYPSKNMAFIYHRHSMTVILPTVSLAPAIESNYVELFERVASCFYNNMLSNLECTSLLLCASKNAMVECAASFLLTLDEKTRNAVEKVASSSFSTPASVFLASLAPTNTLKGDVAFQSKSLDEFANSLFYRRLIARFILTNLDWLLSYSLAMLVFKPENSNDADLLCTFAVVARNMRTLLESSVPSEMYSTDEIASTSSMLSWLADGFVEYALSSSTLLTYLSSHNINPSVTVLGSTLTKLLLPQTGFFILEQFLLDNALFAEFESFQKSIGAASSFPGAGYRLYLYGLSALLQNHFSVALEYFIDSAANLDDMSVELLCERCRPHLSRIQPRVADFWIRILDLAQHLGCTDVAVEAAERAKPYFVDSMECDSNFARVLDMKLFKLQCQACNFRGAISTLLAMKEGEDQVAGVNVIVSTAISESRLCDLIDCLLIDMNEFSDEQINSMVAAALQRALRSDEYADWGVCWSLYRLHLSQNNFREAAAALFEYYGRLPSLSALTPDDFFRRRDALALAYCTLKILSPPCERWLSSAVLKVPSSCKVNESARTVVSIATIDELCRIEDARVELVNACELPEEPDDMDCEMKIAKLTDVNEDRQKPKFEEAAPIILRLGASDLVRWLSAAHLFSAATELCKALQLPCRDTSEPLVDALCSSLDSNCNLLFESDFKECLMRLNDSRPTFLAVHALYGGDLELPSWLWKLASKQDADALLRAAIKHKRLLDSGRIAAVIIERALETEPSHGRTGFMSCLPWWHLDRVVAALHEFANNRTNLNTDGASEIIELHSRLQNLCGRYKKHASTVKQLAENAMVA